MERKDRKEAGGIKNGKSALSTNKQTKIGKDREPVQSLLHKLKHRAHTARGAPRGGVFGCDLDTVKRYGLTTQGGQGPVCRSTVSLSHA